MRGCTPQAVIISGSYLITALLQHANTVCHQRESNSIACCCLFCFIFVVVVLQNSDAFKKVKEQKQILRIAQIRE